MVNWHFDGLIYHMIQFKVCGFAVRHEISPKFQDFRVLTKNSPFLAPEFRWQSNVFGPITPA